MRGGQSQKARKAACHYPLLKQWLCDAVIRWLTDCWCVFEEGGRGSDLVGSTADQRVNHPQGAVQWHTKLRNLTMSSIVFSETNRNQ